MMPYKSGLEITTSRVNILAFSNNSFSTWKEDLTVIEGFDLAQTIL
jgi:hypothetical protein